MEKGIKHLELSRFETLKGRRIGLAIVLFLGLCVFSPALRAPLFLDDYVHVAMVEGTFPVPRGPFDLYDFFSDGNRAALTAQGLLPWWSHPELRIRFFRPLSSALLWGVHRVSAHAALPMHVHSFVWWLLAVLAMRALYRRFFSERVAFLATAIYALSPCHALPLAWIANSENLIALAFGGFALSRHLRARMEGRLSDAALASLGFGLALLSGGEYALAFGGYVLALEVALRLRGAPRATLRQHVGGMLPFVAPALSYLVTHRVLRYGTFGCGFYTDPFRSPMAFLRVLPARAVALLADTWLTLGAETYKAGYERWLLALMVLGVAALLVVPFRRLLAALEGDTGVLALMLLWGSILAIAPTLAVLPSFRLLGVAMIGVAGTTALLLEHAWFSPAARAAGHGNAWVTGAAILLGFSQLVHGPITSFVAATLQRHTADDFTKRAHVTATRLGVPSEADVAVVRGTDAFFLPFTLDRRGRPPIRWRVLSTTGHVLVLRTGERTLEILVPEGKSLYPGGELNLYRDQDSPVRVGEVFQEAGMTVTVLDVGREGPRHARFEFDSPLTKTLWMTDNVDDSTEITLPRVGEGAPFDP